MSLAMTRVHGFCVSVGSGCSNRTGHEMFGQGYAQRTLRLMVALVDGAYLATMLDYPPAGIDGHGKPGGQYAQRTLRLMIALVDGAYLATMLDYPPAGIDGHGKPGGQHGLVGASRAESGAILSRNPVFRRAANGLTTDHGPSCARLIEAGWRTARESVRLGFRRDHAADGDVVTGVRARRDRRGQAFQVAGRGDRAAAFGDAGADDEALEAGQRHARHHRH